MKKLLAMLVVAMGVGSLFAATNAYYTDESGRKWSLTNQTTAVVSGEKVTRWFITGCTPLPEGEFTVPAKIGNMSVWGVADEAFEGATNITSVTVEPGIKYLGFAFYTEVNGKVVKSNIEKVTLPEGLEYVDCDAFQNSKIDNDQAPNGFVVNGYLIKYTGTNETYTIPAGVKHICGTAFYRANNDSSACVLKSIVIPEGVETIQEGAFNRLSRNPFAFGDVVLPDSLKSIGKDAFNKVTFKSLKLGKGITDLNKVGVDIDGNDVSFWEAFNNATIESIDFGDGVEAIPAGLFEANATLKSVKFGAGLRVIGEAAFNSSAVSNADFSAAVKLELIDSSAFSGVPIKSVKFPSTLKTIGSEAFSGCLELEAVESNEGLETIGSYAFENCVSLTSIEVPSTVKFIAQGAFEGCAKLATVKLNEGLEEINSWAFGGCSELTEIDIPGTVTFVGQDLFESCTELTNVTGGAGIEGYLIGTRILGNCPFATFGEFDSEGNPYPEFKVVRFGNVIIGCRGTCPANYTLDASKIGDAEVIGHSAFDCDQNASLSNIVKVVIPETVRTIDQWAFFRNAGLKALDLTAASPELMIGYEAFSETGIEELKGITVSMIDERAFSDCDSLKEVDIAVEPIVVTDENDPENVRYFYANVNREAFAGCSKLTKAKVVVAASIPVEQLDSRTGVGYISEGAFEGCSTLKEVNVAAPFFLFLDDPELLENPRKKVEDSHPFRNCPAIEKATVNAKEIPNEFLNGPTNLTELALGNMVKTIHRNAFEGNKNISAVELPEGLEDICPDAFNGCSNLVTVTGGEALTRVGLYAFLGTKFFNEAPAGALKLGSMLVKWTGDDETVTIPDGITDIASSAFLGCKAVKVIVPESVGIIREGTFEKCPNLSQIEFKNREIQLVTYCIRSKDTNIKSWYDDCPLLDAAGDKALIVPNRGAFILAGWKKNLSGYDYLYCAPDYQKLAFHNDASADGDFVPGSSYSGWIMNGQSDGNNYVVGTVTVKTGKLDKNNEVKVTMTVQLAGVKKNYTAMFKIDENGKAVISDASAKQLNDLAGMYLGGTWLSGQISLAGRPYPYTVRGANSGKEALAGMDGFAGHVWGMYLSSSTSELAPVVNGYSGLSISVAKKGKVKVSGTLADGQKVSATAQMAAGDNGVYAAPFYIQTNGKKGGFGFVIDFYMDGDSPRAWFAKTDDGVGNMTNWQYPLEFGVTDGPNASTFVQIGLSSKKGELFEIDPKGNGLAEGAYTISGTFDDYAQTALNVACKSPFVDASPYAELMVDAKGKWTFAKATKVTLATEKDLEKYQGDIDAALKEWREQGADGSVYFYDYFSAQTSDGKVLEAYDFDCDELLGIYTPKAYLLADVGSKVKGGELILGKNTNYYGVKLSYAKKTGLVSGSSVYYWVDISNADKPKLKKGKTSISGIVLDGAFLGASTVKGVASCKLNSREAN